MELGKLLKMRWNRIGKTCFSTVQPTVRVLIGFCFLFQAMRVEDFTERVYAVALADSVHYIDHNTIPADRLAFLRQVGPAARWGFEFVINFEMEVGSPMEMIQERPLLIGFHPRGF